MVNFIIAGAGKSGTTSLAYNLNCHPDIEISMLKEPRYFTRVKKSELYPKDGNYDKGEEWYNSLFSDRSAKVKGEASTIYFTTPDTPELIRAYNENIKLIFILRSPVDRFYAHYWQEVKSGSIRISLQEMLMKNHPRLERYYLNSSYMECLKRYFALFPKDNIRLLIFEEFCSDEEKHTRELFEFLGVPQVDIEYSSPKNTSAIPRLAWFNFVIRYSMKIIEKYNLRRSVHFIKPIIKPLYNLNQKKQKYPKMEEDLKAMLKKRFSEDIEFIESILQRSINEWNK